MNYLIEIIYIDSKKAQIVLPEVEVSPFLEKLKKKEDYSNAEGFAFINIDSIRYINVRKMPEEVAKDEEKTVDDYSELEDHI